MAVEPDPSTRAQLVRDIVASVREVVPSWLSIRARREDVIFRVTNRPPSTISIFATPSLKRDAESVAQGILSAVQDIIAIETATPWPPTAAGSRERHPLPAAAVVGDELSLWYGDADAPSLRLKPVHLRARNADADDSSR